MWGVRMSPEPGPAALCLNNERHTIVYDNATIQLTIGLISFTKN